MFHTVDILIKFLEHFYNHCIKFCVCLPLFHLVLFSGDFSCSFLWGMFFALYFGCLSVSVSVYYVDLLCLGMVTLCIRSLVGQRPSLPNHLQEAARNIQMWHWQQLAMEVLPALTGPDDSRTTAGWWNR